MHTVKSYDILRFCIKNTFFLHVLVPDKTSFLDHPLIVPLSDMPTQNWPFWTPIPSYWTQRWSFQTTTLFGLYLTTAWLLWDLIRAI